MERTNKSEAEGSSPPKRAAIVILSLGLLGLVVVAVLVSGRIKFWAGSQRITLPDGSQLELLGSALGDTSFTTEKTWHRTVRRLLPARFTNWLPPVITGNCSGRSTNVLTVYFRHISPTTTASTPPPWNYFEAEDVAGFHYGPNTAYCRLTGPPGSVVYGLAVIAFPRRDKEFLFRLASASTQLGSFRISNPVSGRFSEWQPSSMPQSLTNGPVILTLLGLKRRGTSAQPGVVAEWRLEAPGHPSWTNAFVRSVTYQDATGNDGPSPSPREPAWRIRARVEREKPENFDANEKMVLTNLPVPADGTFLPLNQDRDFNGLIVRVLALSATGKLAISNGVAISITPGAASFHGFSMVGPNRIEYWGSATPFLVIEAKDTRPDDDIQFRMRDDRDREVKLSVGGWSGNFSGTRTYQPRFTPPADAKSLTLTVIVNRPLPFEFMVNPADVTQAVK